MGFLIDKVKGHMAVDSVTATIDTSALAGDVAYVSMNLHGECGVQYTDQPMTLDVDPAPYQVFLNAWMTAMYAGGSGALTLTEAKSAKKNLVDALYFYKRQIPVTVATTAGTFAWDASDASSINTSSWIVTANVIMNKIADMLDTMVAMNVASVGIETCVGNYVSQTNGRISVLQTADGSPIDTFDPAPYPDMPVVPGHLTLLPSPSLTLVPVGGTTPVTLTSGDMNLIVSAISAQHVDKASGQATRKSAIDALGNIPDVIAYDVTASW